jgi:hypothetical protein
MCSGDSRHFGVACPRILKVASGKVVINPCNEDKGKGMEQEEEESGKVQASSIWMTIALYTNSLFLQLLCIIWLFLFSTSSTDIVEALMES